MVTSQPRRISTTSADATQFEVPSRGSDVKLGQYRAAVKGLHHVRVRSDMDGGITRYALIAR